MRGCTRAARAGAWLVLTLGLGGGTALSGAPPTPGACAKERSVSGEARIELGTQPLRVPLEGTPPACGEGSRIVLTLHGIDYDQNPGVYYEVYLNLPEDERQPDAQSLHYVGNLSFHGLKAAAAAQGQEATQDFDVTPTVRALQARQRWEGRQASVTFVMSGLLHPRTQEPLPASPGTKARLRRVSLTCE